MAQNRPIESDLKTKRLDMGELIYQSSWAYMRELRTHNKTKEMYDVNPYAEVYQFRDNLYGIFTENLDGGGDSWIYLIIGPEKAMLIDTGFGLGNLKGLADEITGGLPLIVVNTHPHSDHTLGNFQFDKVYIHESCTENLKSSMTNPDIHKRLYGSDGSCLMVDFDRNDFVPQQEYEVIGISDGHIFNLGEDYDIEVIHLAGHSPGQVAYLDKKGRTLFPGDDIISMRVSTISVPGTITEFRDKMAGLSKRTDEFDGIFPGHFIVDLESSCVQSMVDTLNSIIEDPSGYDYTENRKQGLTYCKSVKGLGCIGYSMTGI